MIFVLASLWAYAHAQLNLENAPLPTRGGLESTATEGILRHAPSERSIDLRAFGSRAAPLCARLLEATHAVFSVYLEPLSDPVDGPERPSRKPVRYGQVRSTRGAHVLSVVADPFRADEMFFPADQTPALPLTGAVTEHLEALVAAARRLDQKTSPQVAVVGKFDGAEFHAESLGVTIRVLDMPHFISVLHGEILFARTDLTIVTGHGRQLRLVQSGPLDGTDALRFVEVLNESALGTGATVAGLEVGRELRVFTRR